MEMYLDRSMKSLIIPEVLDEIEIIIVNDGSKDHTLQIAKRYEERYPDSVVVIDKSNGHYGSCINSALSISKGKYFRILDADDWFNSEALLSIVRRLSKVDYDAIYTPYAIYYEKKNIFELQPVPNNISWEKEYNLNEYNLSYPFLHMHCLTYKTALLKKIFYHQTEGVCYTDTEYVYKPLGSSHSIFCINECLYQYYVGRDDQSTSMKVLSKNFNHFYKVLDELIVYKWIGPNSNIDFLKTEYVRILFKYLISIHLEYYHNDTQQSIMLRNALNTLRSQGMSMSFIDNIRIGAYQYAKKWYENRLGLLDRIIWGIKRIKDTILT